MKREQDIDKIFKTNLEDPVDETLFREGDWDALEDMLDAGKKRKIFWLPILSSVAAATLLFFGWILLKPQVADQVKKYQQPLAVTKQPVKGIGDEVTKQTASTTTLPAKTAGRKSAQPELLPAHHQYVAVLKVGKHNGGQSIITGRPSVGIANAGTNVSEKLGSDHKPITNGIANAGTNVSEKLGSDHKPITNIRDYAVLTAVSQKPAMIGANTMNMPAIAAINILPEATAAGASGNSNALKSSKRVIKKTGSLAFRPQYALTIIGSSEANGVGGLKNTVSGYNFGVLFSAELVKKFTLTTGINYAMKPYNIPFAAYHTSYAFKSSPQSVEADCRLLDIPINIGYRVYSTPNNKITVGTGLSSYIMTHENYTYDYGASATAAGPASYLVKGPGKYLLSIMNFQASYQHQINSKVGISLQPYLKVPLTNIGYSQIKMESAGIAVGLNWNLNSILKPR